MPQTETTEFSSSRVQLSAERRAFTQPCASSRHIAGPAVRRTECYRTRRFTTAESMLRRCGDIVSGEHQSRMRGPCNWQAGRVSLTTPCDCHDRRGIARLRPSPGHTSLWSWHRTPCSRVHPGVSCWDLKLDPSEPTVCAAPARRCVACGASHRAGSTASMCSSTRKRRAQSPCALRAPIRDYASCAHVCGPRLDRSHPVGAVEHGY